MDIRPSPKRQNRSRSPLRSNPPEVFARSPRHNRHIEHEEQKSARKSVSDAISEDRVQQASGAAQRQGKPSGSDTEACLDWLHKNCFKEITAIERGIEERKVALCERHDFTLEAAFQCFAESSTMRVGVNEMVQGLDRLGITCD